MAEMVYSGLPNYPSSSRHGLLIAFNLPLDLLSEGMRPENCIQPDHGCTDLTCEIRTRLIYDVPVLFYIDDPC